MDARDINTLTKEELLESEKSIDILQGGERIINALSGFEARDLANILGRKLQLAEKVEGLSAVETKYKVLISVLKVVALPFFYRNEEVIDVFKGSLVEATKIEDLDIRQLVKRKILDLPVTHRDAFKEELRKAMHTNSERLTTKYLVLGEKEVLGTIGNWLSDYIKFVGGGFVDNLKRAEYLSSGPNSRRLDNKELSLLERLIQLYEYLKLSSLTPQGVEEALIGFDYTRGKYYFVNEQGLAEPIEMGITAPPTELTKIPVRPRPSVVSTKAIKGFINQSLLSEGVIKKGQELSQRLREKKIRPLTLVSELYEMLWPKQLGKAPEAINAMAIIYALVENTDIDILFKDLKFKSKFTEYLKEKHPMEAEGFKLNFLEPRYLGLLVKLICVEKLNLSENDAAQFAVRLGNLMKKAGQPEYWDLAYYDMKEKKFKWKG